jgi:hypothetical protein
MGELKPPDQFLHLLLRSKEMSIGARIYNLRKNSDFSANVLEDPYCCTNNAQTVCIRHDFSRAEKRFNSLGFSPC